MAAAALSQTSSFHNTAAQYASPLKKKSGPLVPVRARQSQSAKMKKKVRERPKLQPIGERAALRRRIVLSNTNALEVPGMDNWSSENLVDPELVGKVVGLDGALLDQLRDSKAFKTTQNWSLFRRPATLIRSETLGVGQDMEEISSTQEPKTVRHLISGERASGKSILMLQTMCMAYMKKWIVLNAPEGKPSLRI